MTHARKKQAQVIIDFGHRTHRRARIAARTLLIDRNRRAQSLDIIDVRFLHPTEELTGVSGKRLDIAALSLSIDGIEGERTLAGAGNTGDNHQFIAWDDDIDILEIMLAGTLDNNAIYWHISPNQLPHYCSIRA